VRGQLDGGRLWLAVAAATALFVVADFVRYPFGGAQTGRAAGAAGELTLLVPAGDATDPAAADVRRRPRAHVFGIAADAGAKAALAGLVSTLDASGEVPWPSALRTPEIVHAFITDTVQRGAAVSFA